MKIDRIKLPRLAAAFAISNLGHEVPADIAEGPYLEHSSPRNEVENYAGHLMESDEHEDIFAAEAEMWARDLAKTPVEEVLRIHGTHSPWVRKILEA